MAGGPVQKSNRDAPEWPEERVLELLTTLSNRGRWGASDERGTLNFIDAETRIAAASEVRLGLSVSVGRLVDTVPTPYNVHPARHEMHAQLPDSISCGDRLELEIHGMASTHLDALGHEFFEGKLYNGRRAREEVTRQGLKWANILAQGDGIFTRGVLLDVRASRGVDWLDPTQRITDSDLAEAEALAQTAVRSGDAVLVHCGYDRAFRAGAVTDPGVRAGLGPECLPWLWERQVSVFSGDCIEQLPTLYPRMPFPLHQIGLSAMGLVLLDSVQLDRLSRNCQELQRYSFLLTAAPLLLPGGTGSPVNPVCTF